MLTVEEALKLKGVSVEVAKKFIDKCLMRKYAVKVTTLEETKKHSIF